MNRNLFVCLITTIILLFNGLLFAQDFKTVLNAIEKFEKELKNEINQIKGEVNELKSNKTVEPSIGYSELKNLIDMETVKRSSAISELNKEIISLKKSAGSNISDETIEKMKAAISKLESSLGKLRKEYTENINFLKNNINSVPGNSEPGIVESQAVQKIFAHLDELKTIISNELKKKNDVVIKPYGFFKLDLTYDQSRTNNGNYIMWINKIPEGEDEDAEFNLTARQTRFGFNLDAGELDGRKVTARFENDFYQGTVENKNFLMLRHAYLKIDFKTFYLLAGQTFDVLSPLNPTTVNYTVLWNSGNIGYRRPQLQIGNKVKEGIQITGALTRNVAGDIDENGTDDGEDYPFPTIQGRLSYLKPGKLDVGVSGHYGKMEYSVENEKENYESYSVNVHLNLILSKTLNVKGEAFTGRTLNQYLGGIGQGYNMTLPDEIEASGGWANAVYTPDDKIKFSVGFGIDKPKEESMSPGLRDLNRAIFANFFTKIAPKTSFALEASHWTTGYFINKNESKESSSFRLQAAYILNF
jgi:hypothetical protein